MEEFPDTYQHERALALGVSDYAVWYGLKRLGIKKRCCIKSETAIVASNTVRHCPPFLNQNGCMSMKQALMLL